MMIEEKKQNVDEEISLQELISKFLAWINYLSARWFYVVIIGLIGAVIGFTYTNIRKPVYTATTTFVLEEGERGLGLGTLGGLASIAGIDLGGGGGLFQGDNIMELYRSRTMIQQALLSEALIDNKKTKLIDRFIEFNDLKTKWKKTDWSKADFADTSKFTIVQDSILREVVKEINKNYLKIDKPDRKLSKIEVNVKAKDQVFAKVFSNQIVDVVNKFYINTKTGRSRKNVAILQHKTDSVKSVMNGAIYTAVAITDATPNINPTRQIQRVAPAQKAQFSIETNKAVLSEMLKNLEISKTLLLKETPLIQIVDQPIYPLESDKISSLKGLVFASVLFSFLAVAFFSIKLFFKNVFKD